MHIDDLIKSRVHMKLPSLVKNVTSLSEQDQGVLNQLQARLDDASSRFLGYPTNASLSFSELAPFLDYTINNVGDPFTLSNYGVNTHIFEQEVLHFFADLLHAPKDEWWGYVSNGGTEGNMWGIYLGRERYPDGILYFSDDTHYSISKIARVLNMRHVIVQSLPSGEIDYTALYHVIDETKPVILNLNIGTTMKGGICRIDKVLEVLKRKGIEKFYIHCDAALFGIMLPFIENAPPFDFRFPIDSITISGHKFLGSPIPSGIVIARKGDVDCVRRHIEYIGSSDCTISGSRDGFSVLILWTTLKKLGIKGISESVQYCLKMTDYTLEKIHAIGWPVWKNEFSNIVVLKRPEKHLIEKWQLATHGPWSHIVVMPHVRPETIDCFVEDLQGMARTVPART